MEKRIIDLEKKLSFQEHTIQELNTVILDQNKKIDFLEKQFDLLKTRLSNEEFVKKQEDEIPPPHY